jgi:hypothetical protein
MNEILETQLRSCCYLPIADIDYAVSGQYSMSDFIMNFYVRHTLRYKTTSFESCCHHSQSKDQNNYNKMSLTIFNGGRVVLLFALCHVTTSQVAQQQFSAHYDSVCGPDGGWGYLGRYGPDLAHFPFGSEDNTAGSLRGMGK